jgi:hypothetical protein
MRTPSAAPRRAPSSVSEAAPPALPEYLSRNQVCKLLHVGRRQVAELARLGRVGVRQLPGVAPTRYRRADVERIAAAAFVPARDDQPPEVTTPPSTKPGRPARRSG